MGDLNAGIRGTGSASATGDATPTATTAWIATKMDIGKTSGAPEEDTPTNPSSK